MLAHYFAVALRNIRRAPTAFAINVVTLALGLVCFVTAYAYIAFWERADRHFETADRIYLLTMRMSIRESPFGTSADFFPSVPLQAGELLRTDFPALDTVARAVVIDRKTMIASDERSARLNAVAVEPEFLDLFPLPFVAGDADTALTSPGSVVLTREAARQLFGDDDPIGRRVILANAVEAAVTGVVGPVREPSHLGRTSLATMPFDLLASFDMLDAVRAVTTDSRVREFMATQWFGDSTAYLRLPERGLSRESLEAQLGDFAARHVPAEALKRAGYEFGLRPVTELIGRGSFMRTGLRFGTVLLMLGGLVLGVACLNYANLATARAARRTREIGVRKALGAAPAQIAAQSLLEAGVLTAAALVAAVIVFLLGGPVMRDLLRVDLAPTLFESVAIWPFLVGLVAAVTFLAGFYPAVVLARVQPASAIAAADAGLGSKLLSTLLVGTQFAVASALLLFVIVLALQNAALARSGLSLTEDPLLVIENPTRITKVSADTLRAELGRVPQVKALTEAGFVPWEMTMLIPLSDSPDPTSAARPLITRGVGEDFFEVFDIKLVAGRVLGGEHAEDLPAPAPPPPSIGSASAARGEGSNATSSGGGTRPNTAPPAGTGGASPAASTPAGAEPASRAPPRQTNIVVDRLLVEEFGLATPEEAVGKQLYMLPNPNNAFSEALAHNIVGVVENRSFSVFNFQGTSGAHYRLGRDFENVIARIDRHDVAGALAAIDARWRELAPNVPITRRFLDDVFNQAFEQQLRVNRLFSLLALMAFAISTAGLFGMSTLVAARRRQEIGVRKTFGASTMRIARMLLAGFSKPVVIANVAIWPLMFVAVRAHVRQFLEPIPITPLPFIASLLITLAIAWIAVGGQTLRAARRKPAEVLRHE